MFEFTYEQLLAFGSAMSIYFVVTLPIYLFYLLDSCIELVHKIKEYRNKKNEN